MKLDKYAIISKSTVELTEEEIKGAASFHKRRIAFAFVNDECVFNTDPDDDRDHQHWICEDYGFTKEEFEKLIRGYMLPGKIFLYESSCFSEIDLAKMSVKDMFKLLSAYKKAYREENVVLYNGVQIGVVGEEWPGKNKLATMILN